MRGVCAAAYLTRLEESVGQPLHRDFDLICGTSVGGVIAIAQVLEVPMKKVLDMFSNRAASVFQRRYPRTWRCLAMSID